MIMQRVEVWQGAALLLTIAILREHDMSFGENSFIGESCRQYIGLLMKELLGCIPGVLTMAHCGIVHMGSCRV